MKRRARSFDYFLSQVPAHLQDAISYAYKLLSSNISHSLDSFEPHLLSAAKEAHGEAATENLLNALDLINERRDFVEASFSNALQRDFIHLFNDDDQDLPLLGTNSNIDMMASNVLESKIAIQKIIADVARQCERQIDELTDTLAASMPTRGVTRQNNPLGPEFIAMALFESIQQAHIASSAEQQFFLHCQQQWFDQFRSFYRQVIDKITANQGKMTTPENTARHKSYTGTEMPMHVDSSAAQSMLGTIAEDNSVEEALFDSSFFESSITDHIAKSQIPNQLSVTDYECMQSSVDDANGKLIKTAPIVQLLQKIQTDYIAKDDGEILLLIKEQLAKNSFILSQADENKINLNSLIFRNFANQSHQDFGNELLKLKPIYARLFLSDDIFINDPKHPARELINQLLLIGNTVANDKALSLLKKITATLQKKFTGDNQLFIQLLHSVKDFLSDSRDVNISEKISYYQTLYKSQLATKNLIRANIGDIECDKNIKVLFILLWKNTLAKILTDEGKSSPEWKKSTQLLALAFHLLKKDTSKNIEESLTNIVIFFNKNLIDTEHSEIFKACLLSVIHGSEFDESKLIDAIEDLHSEDNHHAQELSIGHEHLLFPNGESYQLVLPRMARHSDDIMNHLAIGQWFMITLEMVETPIQLGLIDEKNQCYAFFDRDHQCLFKRSYSDFSNDVEKGFAYPLESLATFDYAIDKVCRKLNANA